MVGGVRRGAKRGEMAQCCMQGDSLLEVRARSFRGVELGLWQALAAEIRLRVQISRRAVAGISLADDPLKNPCNRHVLLSVPSQPSLGRDQTLIRLINVLTC